MLVALVGPAYSGVRLTAKILRESFGFSEIFITKNSNPEEIEAAKERGSLIVGSCEEALEIVSPRWQEHFVLLPIKSNDEVTLVKKRPFCVLLGVDAPLLPRFDRCVKYLTEKNKKKAGEGESVKIPSLEEFCRKDDSVCYGEEGEGEGEEVGRGGLRLFMQNADHVIFNQSNSPTTLLSQLSLFSPLSPEHLRPKWDTYFISLAFHASKRSNCMKRRVGAVLVMNNRVVATGYNGTPRGTKNCNEGGCPRCNGGAVGGQGLDHCFCMHAEENAILEAGRERSEGTTMYTTLFPCLTCAKKMVQVGVKTLVYSECYVMDELSRSLLVSVGIAIRQHSPVVGQNNNNCDGK